MTGHDMHPLIFGYTTCGLPLIRPQGNVLASPFVVHLTYIARHQTHGLGLLQRFWSAVGVDEQLVQGEFPNHMCRSCVLRAQRKHISSQRSMSHHYMMTKQSSRSGMMDVTSRRSSINAQEP